MLRRIRGVKAETPRQVHVVVPRLGTVAGPGDGVVFEFVRPDPEQIIDLTVRVATQTWPHGEAQRRAWFEELGMAPTRAIGSWTQWGGGILGWGDAEICWSREGERADADLRGVGWYLWGEEGTMVALETLVQELTRRLGPATRRAGAGFPWYEWHVGERVVELGGSSLDPRIQIHIVHQETDHEAAEHLVDAAAL